MCWMNTFLAFFLEDSKIETYCGGGDIILLFNNFQDTRPRNKERLV